MFSLIYRICKILDSNQKWILFRIQFLVISISILEILVIFSFGGLVSFLTNTNNISNGNIYIFLSKFYEFNNDIDFIIFYSILLFIVVIISSVSSVYGIWRISMYAASVGVSISSDLFKNMHLLDMISILADLLPKLIKRL